VCQARAHHLTENERGGSLSLPAYRGVLAIKRGPTGFRRINDWPPREARVPSPWPLSLVQIDHTLVDVIVVDSITREPIQRPWLTLSIDVCSRCVPGFHLSLEPPSATSVALCLAHAALPKEGWLAARGIDQICY
jgi:transposase InsO family protein